MKFTYNWLKQYVDFDWSPQQLAEKLTFAGIEVEDIVTLGGKIPEQVVIGQILASEKHPNADKLSVCRVNDGTGERQIVCGAKNYKVGDKVPLALPGAAMGAGFTIKESKLRGILSQGMMCSAEELGLPKGEDGLLILPADAPLGKKFAEYVGPGDTVYDIEVTPNRPDWLSVIGIAREIAALTGNALKLPEIPPHLNPLPHGERRQTGSPLPTGGEGQGEGAGVLVEAPDLCPRYTARMIRGVKVGPSPAWLQQILEKVGLRSINNVVDVTNYVLLESGHPLHAFDFNLLKGNRIVVRRAKVGEEFAALVGSQHKLTGEMLVIADAERAVALAGVMGGQNSEINDATTDVLLESAWFLPANVRKTSKQLSLASDSSYRFERGADIGGVIWASNRAALLIQQLAGGTIGGFVDVLAQPVVKRRVKCRYAQVNRVLGVEVPPAKVQKIFAGLSLVVVAEDATGCEVEVPTFRVDLEREADLIEEVCRIYGVENIPAKMQPALPAVSAFDAQWDERCRVRETLNALGFHEALNQTMVSEGALKLQNPLNAEMTALRHSLVPGLLQNLRTNVSRHQYDVRLFEIGRVFAADGKESLRLALAATGRRTTGDWERTEKTDYFDLKGALEQLGVTAEITEIPEKKAKKLDLRDAVYCAEFDFTAATKGEKQFAELPKFPAIVRDVALVVDEAITHQQVLEAVERTNILEQVALFDVFRGGSIPAGKKSVAYSLTFRAGDRTLTDAEVNAAHARIKQQLQMKLACEIRVS
ncbi:MAG: phenylalanine--tRNA ligase subunit beta [Verrucomicrobiota bacterium]